jgi:hypothetical protein
MQPKVGDWYRFREGARFKVTAIGELISIEYEDGVYSEFDLAEWNEDVRTGFLDNSSPP